jgi:hypothetical protein
VCQNHLLTVAERACLQTVEVDAAIVGAGEEIRSADPKGVDVPFVRPVRWNPLGVSGERYEECKNRGVRRMPEASFIKAERKSGNVNRIYFNKFDFLRNSDYYCGRLTVQRGSGGKKFFAGDSHGETGNSLCGR